MLSMPTVRGNCPNFTFLTIFLLVRLMAVLLSLCAAHSSAAGERLRLWMICITLTSAALTGHFLLPHHPKCISHKDSTASWRGAQHMMGRGATAEPFLFCPHCTLFLICSTIPANKHYPTITYDFPMDCTQRT